MALTKIPSSLLDTSGGFDLQGNITLGDNEQIQLGDSGDLAIYHDGSHSYISDQGTGQLRILVSQFQIMNAAGTESIVFGAQDNTATLYYDNSPKIATSSTGATVTGNLAVTGDLDITGNVNSYNVTDLDVTDQTITLGAGQTEANSGGSGIIVDGSSASILWDETNDEWDFNKSINVATGGINVTGVSTFNTHIQLTEAQKIQSSASSGGSHLLLRDDNLGVTGNSMSLIGLNDILIGAKSNNSGTGNIYFGVGAENKASGSSWIDTLTILESGDVGIGTSSPQAHLDINTEAAEATTVIINGEINQDKILKFRHYSNSEAAGDGYAGFIGSVVDNLLTLGHYNSSNSEVQALHITEGGNVMIGTTTPSGLLNVDGNLHWGGQLRVNDPSHDGTESNPSICVGYDNDNGFFRPTSNTIAMTTAGTERMRITATGNVGIGVTNPDSYVDDNNSLVVAGQVRIEGVTNSGTVPLLALADNNSGLYLPSANVIAISTAGVEKMRIDGNKVIFGNQSTVASSGYIEKLTSGDYSFNIYASSSTTTNRTITFHNRSNTEAMRIDTSGNLIVGSTSIGNPSGTATVRSKIQVGETEGQPSSDNYNSVQVYNYGRDGVYSYTSNVTYNNHMLFLWRGSVAGSITSPNATSVAYNTSSDYRLKENVDYEFNALDRVAQLKPARFNFIADADTTVDGFLAHEVQDIVPEAISGEKDAVDSDGNPEYQGIDQSKLVPLLTKAIQELKTELDAAKARITELEG